MSNFRVPDEFIRVVTKMNPEITNIEVENVKKVAMIDSISLRAVEKFMVDVKVYFKGHTWKGTREYYSEILNNLFSYTYSEESEFVRFGTVIFSLPPEETNGEKFNKLFGQGKIENQ